MKGSRTGLALCVTGLLGALAGCVGSSSYEVDVPEPEAPASAESSPSWPSLTVKPGDTLYSIAFSAGADWRQLAAINGIAAPYIIYPGQKLRLVRAPVAADGEPEPGQPERASLPIPAPAESAKAEQPTLPLPLPAPATPTPPAHDEARSSAPPGQPPAQVPAPPAASPAVPKNPAPSTTATIARSGTVGAWRWPAGGKLVRGFAAGAQPHKGIDIAGNTGDPVYAANGGTVVYAGNGVRGYGNLLIVKHDSQYLSAYAHNNRLLVGEGEVVDAGQKIAEIGNSGTDRVKLHFELRRHGNPVDPLKVLPKR